MSPLLHLLLNTESLVPIFYSVQVTRLNQSLADFYVKISRNMETDVQVITNIFFYNTAAVVKGRWRYSR